MRKLQMKKKTVIDEANAMWEKIYSHELLKNVMVCSILQKKLSVALIKENTLK